MSALIVPGSNYPDPGGMRAAGTKAKGSSGGDLVWNGASWDAFSTSVGQALVSADGDLAEAAVASTTGTPGAVRKLSDGPNKGAALTWAIPEGRTTYAWCWQIYPLAAYL